MYFVNMIAILVYIMLAILSRKHFSKYKRTGNLLAYITCFFCGIGDYIYRHFGSNNKEGGIKNDLRKCYVVSQENLQDIKGKFYIRLISGILGVFFFFNILSLIVGLVSNSNTEEVSNIVQRDDYGGKEEEYIINLKDEEGIEEYTFAIAPVEYSPEEIYESSLEVFEWLETAILGENSALDNISFDLCLPDCDEDNVFDISWRSKTPMLLNSRGELILENISGGETIVVTAVLKYKELSFERDYVLTLRGGLDEKTKMDIAKDTLVLLEKESRHEKEVVLPENIDGIDISIASKKREPEKKIFIVGIIVCLCMVVGYKEKLNREVKARDKELLRCYPVFVNKLYLFMKTGMTIKNALIHIASKGEEQTVLSRELEYTMNQIRAGRDEAKAYEDLGSRLMLSEYIRLMNQISHNLRIGNYDLLESIREQAEVVAENQKENIKRLGEEASTKLLFPMTLLLLVVMMIIIIPAMYGF